MPIKTKKRLQVLDVDKPGRIHFYDDCWHIHLRATRVPTSKEKKTLSTCGTCLSRSK